MPRFEPFAAWRYAPASDLDALLAPPYDVLSDDDVAALRARDPHNIVHVDVPGGDSPRRYLDAAETLRSWMADGVLVLDDAPAFTIYRMRFTDAAGVPRDIAGVLGALEVVDEGAGGVLPHERTTPKASTDRLDLTRATGANLSPVWGLSLATGLTDVLRAPGEFLGAVVVDGVEHRVERVTDPARLAAITAVIGADDVLVADGHHRYGVARQYRDETRAATGRDDTPAELTLTFVNELVADQLSIEAIHRLYDGIAWDDLVSALARRFDIVPLDGPVSAATLREMVEWGRLVLLRPDGAASWLVPTPGAFDGLRALDGAWLEAALAGTPAQVSYQHGLDEMLGVVAGHAAGVLIRPTSIAEILRTGREGLLMPPKSTFFTPKLRTGLVLRQM
ncbi:MAG: DUF1015 domain-containing protein [Actinomycetia bacterium]|nr:DUF1015 domain-containing protein [Actinomycetes bacterium]